MPNVVRLADVRRVELRAVALRLIDELGDQAGYVTGLAARSFELEPSARARLRLVADEIEAVQGYGWHFKGTSPEALGR